MVVSTVVWLSCPRFIEFQKECLGLWSSAEALHWKISKPPCLTENPWGRRLWIFLNRKFLQWFYNWIFWYKKFTQRPYGRKPSCKVVQMFKSMTAISKWHLHFKKSVTEFYPLFHFTMVVNQIFVLFWKMVILFKRIAVTRHWSFLHANHALSQRSVPNIAKTSNTFSPYAWIKIQWRV